MTLMEAMEELRRARNELAKAIGEMIAADIRFVMKKFRRIN